MKKNLLKVLLGLTLLSGATIYVATPVAPHHYKLHVVKSNETMEGIIKCANQNFDVNYDIREAVTNMVTESNKLDGGAKSSQLQVGDKVAVPIYCR